MVIVLKVSFAFPTFKSILLILVTSTGQPRAPGTAKPQPQKSRGLLSWRPQRQQRVPALADDAFKHPPLGESETTQLLIKCRIPESHQPAPPRPARGAPPSSRAAPPSSPRSGRAGAGAGRAGGPAAVQRRSATLVQVTRDGAAGGLSPSHRSRGSHTRRRDWTETPSPESSPGTKWRRKWKRKEGPTSHTHPRTVMSKPS